MSGPTHQCGHRIPMRKRRWPETLKLLQASKCGACRQRDYLATLDVQQAAQTPETIAAGSALYAELHREA